MGKSSKFLMLVNCSATCSLIHPLINSNLESWYLPYRYQSHPACSQPISLSFHTGTINNILSDYFRWGRERDSVRMLLNGREEEENDEEYKENKVNIFQIVPCPFLSRLQFHTHQLPPCVYRPGDATRPRGREGQGCKSRTTKYEALRCDEWG